MALARTIAVAFLIVVWTFTPDVACLIPGIELTVDEHECCRRMAGECGAAPMQDIHTCCKTVSRPGAMLVSKSFDAKPLPADVMLTAPLESVTPQIMTAWLASLAWSGLGPPPTEGHSISILRI